MAIKNAPLAFQESEPTRNTDDDFPIAQVIGKHYTGSDYGYEFEGVIALAEITENGFITITNTEGNHAFAFNRDYMSWYYVGNDLLIDIRYVGTYTIHDVNTSI